MLITSNEFKPEHFKLFTDMSQRLQVVRHLWCVLDFFSEIVARRFGVRRGAGCHNCNMTWVLAEAAPKPGSARAGVRGCVKKPPSLAAQERTPLGFLLSGGACNTI